MSVQFHEHIKQVKIAVQRCFKSRHWKTNEGKDDAAVVCFLTLPIINNDNEYKYIISSLDWVH